MQSVNYFTLLPEGFHTMDLAPKGNCPFAGTALQAGLTGLGPRGGATRLQCRFDNQMEFENHGNCC